MNKRRSGGILIILSKLNIYKEIRQWDFSNNNYWSSAFLVKFAKHDTIYHRSLRWFVKRLLKILQILIKGQKDVFIQEFQPFTDSKQRKRESQVNSVN